MHFSLVKMMLQNTCSSNGFDDIILPLRHALARLGFTVETRVNSINPASVNILFGTCLIPGLLDRHFPSGSIIFNLEQVAVNSAWNNPAYVEHLRSFNVWDYSPRNIAYLKENCGLTRITEMPLGYVPEMTRLRGDFPQDIDVLFYGAINERRKTVLDDMTKEGFKMGVMPSGYGIFRDHAIARAKIVLNIHYYTPAILEMARLGYLWANAKAVLSEKREDTEIPSGLENVCMFRPYEELTAAARELLKEDAARRDLGQNALAVFSAHRQEDFLEKVVGRHVHTSALPTMPRHLHAGSGKDFRPECLNVDITSGMNPDLVLDLSKPLDFEARHATVRFGDITLRPGRFSRITAFEILEHVEDLPQTMRNFLELLGTGGELELSVPYELSLGAWQDPTHRRAFNENSWLYYTAWAWYMGWRNHRFDLVFRDFVLSEFGKTLEAEGLPPEAILRTPRAVDHMRVILRKRRSTDKEKEEFDVMTRSFYTGAVGEWEVQP